ncbi:hypothetical protein ACM26V_17440 [Salipaludibacillus sp. HK11]|uniref:hypothetical protein n=1 Tax=Salipaludibacillus sp. HK11 TaxID=3394320 RepID=UPI0039FBF59F
MRVTHDDEKRMKVNLFRGTNANPTFQEQKSVVKNIAKKSMLKSFLTSSAFDLSSWIFTAVTTGTALIPSQVVNETMSMVTDSRYIRKANEQVIRDLAFLYQINESDLRLKLESEMVNHLDETKKKVETSRKVILGSVRIRTKLGLFGNFLPAIGSLVTAMIVYKSIENFGHSVLITINKIDQNIL